LTAVDFGLQTNIAGPITSLEGGTGNTATASITVGDVMQVGYASNLSEGDSYVNITNSGQSGGNICVNVYAFNANEAMVACCSCLVSPGGLASLSVRNDLISNTLISYFPSSITMNLIPTAAGPSNSCNPASVSVGSITTGLRAWNTTLHANQGVATGYQVTERPLVEVGLSSSQLTNLAQTCFFIQANGSGFGICKSCSTGGQGAAKQ